MDDVSAITGSSPFAARSAAAILSLRKGDKMVNSFRFWLTTSAVFLIALPDTGRPVHLHRLVSTSSSANTAEFFLAL